MLGCLGADEYKKIDLMNNKVKVDIWLFKKYLNLTSSPWASKSSTNTPNNSLPNPTSLLNSKTRTTPSNSLTYLRLWNELSIAILSFLFNPQIKGRVQFDFYTDFVKKFQKNIDPIKLLKIIK